MPRAAAEGFRPPALVTITCPGLQLLPSAKAHGMRSDISRGMCCPLRHIPGSSSVVTFYLAHTWNPWTHTEPKAHISWVLTQPPAAPAPRLVPHGFGKALVQGPVLKSSPQGGSQRWQVRLVCMAVIPQSNQEHSYTLLSH